MGSNQSLTEVMHARKCCCIPMFKSEQHVYSAFFLFWVANTLSKYFFWGVGAQIRFGAKKRKEQKKEKESEQEG